MFLIDSNTKIHKKKKEARKQNAQGGTGLAEKRESKDTCPFAKGQQFSGPKGA